MLYSEKVMDHFEHPRNVGEIEDADGIGEVGNAKCGDIMRMYLKIDDDGTITDCKFKTFGCGSACTSGSLDPSHVLLAIGLPHSVAHGSLRLSLSEYNTMEEVEYVLSVVPGVVEYLRDMSPVWEELEKGELEHVI